MTRLLFLILISTTVTFSSLQAQVFTEALRYSRLDFGGTARSMGVAGSMSALGTDFAVLSTNPAGLAAYRSSDFMFTPAFKINNTSSELIGASQGATSKNSFRLLLDNIGYVYASEPFADKWAAVNFGIGINKVADFYRKFEYEGVSRGSIVNRFIEQANGRGIDELYIFEEGLAFDTGAIFETFEPGVYGSDFQDAPDAGILRRESVKMTGAINELVVSLGANYNHKLMMGVTFGVPIVRYQIDRTYNEENPDETVPFFNDLTFKERVTTTGSGFNMKLGIIYRPIQMIRVGLAVHTPTRFSLNDDWETEFTYDYTYFDEDGNEINEAQPQSAVVDQPFEYSMRTPMRLMGSLGLLFNKRGFLTAEVEYLDYSKNSFDLTVNISDTGTAQLEQGLNARIDNNFGSALNLKLGGELAVDKFRIRAGYAMFGTSYADKSSFDPTYSFGLGLREDTYYFDFAYRLSQFSDEYTPYYLVDNTSFERQEVANESIAHKLIFTLGFRF